MDDATAVERILDTADRLFYEQGLLSVGMDRIRDASGVSLKRIYRLFSAKEDLVVASLRRRDQSFLQALTTYTDELATPRDKILGVFDFLEAWFREPDFRGCAFINAFGEMGPSSPCVAEVVRDQKHALHELLAGLVAEADGPTVLADQLFILVNGAITSAAILASPDSARHAQAAARALLDAASL
jgi:AcrR family transcriptional regulator